jgi:hypothetical protein
MNELWRRQEFRVWLAVVGAATLVLGAAYSMVQQDARLAANDTPVAITESAKHMLEAGSDPTDVVAKQKTDLRRDSWVFTIVTDSSRHVMASSADLDGKTPLPPQGVFDYTAKNGTDKITWQPAGGVRLATYTTTYKSDSGSGYIISGQSLKLTEDRIGKITLIAFTAWVITVGWVSLALLLPTNRRGNK